MYSILWGLLRLEETQNLASLRAGTLVRRGRLGVGMEKCFLVVCGGDLTIIVGGCINIVKRK